MNTYKVTLTKEERDQLMTITRSGTHAAKKVMHALILLNVDKGAYSENHHTNEKICKILKIGMRTIDRVKKRFVEEGFDAALKMAREPPEGYARWSLRLLADKMVELRYVENISHETVRRTLKKTNLSLGK